MNPRVEMMVQSRELEVDAASDREVVARWRDAIRRMRIREAA